ncbi:MAG: hypothetical protein M1836_004071 [Candelina mexicana]|nr:MAG: hypothetical protein M1836_004071 [Candelina mexicana]
MAAPAEFPYGSQIPTVTIDDLEAFHAQHLSPEAVAHFPFGLTPDTEHPDLEDDDGLGYYADGVKRTLTDEQIAMFRHSEIQTLLRERRHARENREAEMSEEGEIGEDTLDGLAMDCTEDELHGARHTSELFTRSGEVPSSKELQEPLSDHVGKRDDDFGMDANVVVWRSGDDVSQTQTPSAEALDDEDQAYEEFLRKERLQMAREAKKRKRNLEKPGERDAGEKTERRIAREQDESKDVSRELDYGDDSGPPDSSTKEPQPKKQQLQHPLGRRLVAYGDEGNGAGNAFQSSLVATRVEKKAFLWPKIGP